MAPRNSRLLIITAFALLAFALVARVSFATPPGPGDCSHGASDQECRPDPSDNGRDCEAHGHGGVNEDHCLPPVQVPSPLPVPSPSPSPSTLPVPVPSVSPSPSPAVPGNKPVHCVTGSRNGFPVTSYPCLVLDEPEPEITVLPRTA